MKRAAPCGSWPSPLDAGRIATAGRRLSQPRLRGDEVTWLEGRPDEGGRQVVVRARPGRPPEDLTPPGVDVRTRVHEYGGGEYGFAGGTLCYSATGKAGIQRQGAEPLGAGEARARYADLVGSPDGRWLLAVEELAPPGGGEPRNRLVAFHLASGARRIVVEGHDFVSTPRFAPDGRRLACLVWDHPRMPWDGTTLLVLPWRADGPAGAPRAVAGGEGESIFQPGFSPGGILTFVSDRSGWWNLYQERAGGIVALCPRAAEFGLPQWGFGMSTWGFEAEESLLCTRFEEGCARLGRLRLGTGTLEDLSVPVSTVEGLDVGRRHAAFIGAGPQRPPTVFRMDLADGRLEELGHAFAWPAEPGWISTPEALTFQSGDARVHAFLYRPTSPSHEAPPGERPPLLVKSHGGPTSAAGNGLKPALQYWTSRGFAVVDVNYRGSTGFGRAYREALRGAWGVVDVDDCTAAALHLSDTGVVDGARLAVSGGSAGGFTTLCALTFRDVFRVGASHYGIGDLEALARDTHKFESRYLDGLVGPWPARSDLYRERSPIHHAERLSCPVIFFQGLEDPVVPPAQAEAMVAALARRGLPYAYVAFPGERHGFRRAENIQVALEGELFFYAKMLGFPTDVTPPVEIVRPAAGRRASAPGRG